MEPVLTEKHGELTIEIHADENPESPRDWDNMGKMVCFHSRYELGDKHDHPIEEARLLEDADHVLSLPLYLYDHGGITMRTTPFGCPWDSGKVGFIYVTKAAAREEYGVKRLTKAVRERALGVLRSEVEVYDRYLTGAVNGYVVKDGSGEIKDSCWGFYGDPEEVMKEAKSAAGLA